MKNSFIVVLVMLLTCVSNSRAQSWEAKLENAQYETRVNNFSAFTSEVKKTQGIFTDDDFLSISNRCLSKDGVFKLILSPDKSTITIYFLDWIDQTTIHWLFTEANPSLGNQLRIHPRVEFIF